MDYLVFIYCLTYAFSIYFEATAYTLRNNRRATPGFAYNSFQKMNFWGRFGPVFGLPLIGISLDTGINTNVLANMFATAHVISGIIYWKTSPITRISKCKIRPIWIVGMIIHAFGMHSLFLTATILPELRATLLLLGGAINGVGTFILVFYVEKSLAEEIDQKSNEVEYQNHQYNRIIAHLFSAFFANLITYFI